MKKGICFTTSVFIGIATFLLNACSSADPEWPDQKVLDELNYQEIRKRSSQTSGIDYLPFYPGGFQGIINDIQKEFTFPEEARQAGVSGRVLVDFIIEKDGYVNEVKVGESVHPSLDAEAIRLVESLQRFAPAFQEGMPVRMSYTLPINFKLE